MIARKIKELIPSAFKYRQVTCLAFNIGCNTTTGEYFRFPDSDSGDMRGKCSKMMHAMLIPSFGMEICTNLYCVKGGVIFNVDGRGSGSSEVVVKGHMGPPLVHDAVLAAKTAGEIEKWAPFAIPRHA